MIKNPNQSTSGGESGWEGFTEDVQEQVPFRPEQPAIDKDFDTRTEDQIKKQQRSESLGHMRAEVMGSFQAKEHAEEMKDAYATRLSPSEQERLAEQETEQMRSTEEHWKREEQRWNIEHYGANISEAAARNGFNKEYYHLRHKIEREERAVEKEREMSPKESQKAYKKREKRGEVVTAAEREHFRELESIQNLGSDTDKENYGRDKERYFRESQENMKANKRRFKKRLKEQGLSMPKTWDDPSCSLSDLRRIDNLTRHLRPDYDE